MILTIGDPEQSQGATMSAQGQEINANWPTEQQAECPLCHGTDRHVLIRDVEDLNQHVVPGLWT
jgi:hypothetical protein